MILDVVIPFDLSANVPILGLESQLIVINPIPLANQLVIETDKIYCNGQNRQKIGDGYNAYNDLPYTLWEDILDYGTILSPNNNTPIDAGTILSPAVNFYFDFCIF